MNRGIDDEYAWPDGPWVRANMVSTVDGAAQGADGLSGSINTEADHEIFQHLRRTADAIVVGAGTARAEGYGPVGTPIVVVSGRGVMPEKLAGGDNVRLERGGDVDELRTMIARLHADGHEHLLVEGGPTLLDGLLRAGAIDELCVTIAPRLVAGAHRRIVDGPDIDVDLELVGLLESSGTLLARYRVLP